MGTIPSFPTFTAGEIPTAAKLTMIKTAGDFWALTPRCGVVANAAQSIATSPTVFVLFTAWNAETFDIVQSGDSPMHDTVTNPERIFIRTTGKYQISGQVTFDANATGFRSLMLRANSGGSPAGGTTLYSTSQGAGASGRTSVPISPVVTPLSAGDYIEVFVLQNSGAALLTTGGGGYTSLTVKLDAA